MDTLELRWVNPTKVRKKLIEVAMPLDAINVASAREKSIRHGHPSTLHLWWARRPLAAARAVIFAQMVDDPSSVPEEFPSKEAQEAERQRLFRIIEDMVPWEATNNEEILERARQEIRRSWRRACADNHNHPQAAELFNPEKLPGFHDPFAGGGTLPLEAQRLGLEAYASDLNPVAVLINKAMIEIPPKFAGRPPVNPESRGDKLLIDKAWKGAEGLAEDVRYYGKWMRDEAFKRVGHLYPQVEITSEMAAERDDLKPLVGQMLTVIAWIWARTVKSPNPAFANAEVPLVSSFWLSKKLKKEAWVLPRVDPLSQRWSFKVQLGVPSDTQIVDSGTKVGRGDFLCLLSGSAIPVEYIRQEAKSNRVGQRLLAIVVEGPQGRLYLSSTPAQESTAICQVPDNPPDSDLPEHALGFRLQNYGVSKHKNLFSPRQLKSLTVLCDLVDEVRLRVLSDAVQGGDSLEAREELGLPASGDMHSDAIATYLALSVSRRHDRWTSFSIWHTGGEKIESLIRLNALPMTWEFAEANPFSESSGNWLDGLALTLKALQTFPANPPGQARQMDAGSPNARSHGKYIVSTDPPYYDNIPYAALSDLFYIWLRRALLSVVPELFQTLLVPKETELIADPHRHANKAAAEAFFLDGTSNAVTYLSKSMMPQFPITIFYAFKQTESSRDGSFSTGWETFLGGLIAKGLSIVGTWPIRTEQTGGLRNQSRNSLASSVVLVCRPRDLDAAAATQREFLSQLKRELPEALNHLREGNIALVDLQQASIGPGMDVFTRYSKVIGANGKPMTVRDALIAINQILDELVAEREGEMDRETQWAIAWFDHAGFAEGDFGIAENLSKAKNTSVNGMEKSGLIAARAGKVRLLRPEELPAKWDPQNPKLSAWEILHRIVHTLESQGENAAAAVVKKLGGKTDFVPDLCLGLHRTCELKKRAAEAMWYNSLGQSWHEICQLAQHVQEQPEPQKVQERLEL